MHQEILNNKQSSLLPFLGKFSPDFGLVGGTAIALHIGHRESIDFDLFTHNEDFNGEKILTKFKKFSPIERMYRNDKNELTFLAQNVQITFLYYPYPIEFLNEFQHGIHLPDLLTLGAMKLYALGRRAKWKDYVDMYFILRNFHSLYEIIAKAQKYLEMKLMKNTS